MNRDLTVRQWQNFQHHNHMHRANAPRTAREAFGSEFRGEDRREDVLVLIVAVIAFVIGLMVTL